MFNTKINPDPHSNDPYLINPNGTRVQVPQERVADLVDKGFTLEDPNWEPISDSKENPNIPRPLSEINKEMQLKEDILEAIAI